MLLEWNNISGTGIVTAHRRTYTMANNWFLRISILPLLSGYDLFEAIEPFFTDLSCSTILAMEHTGDDTLPNPHFHVAFSMHDKMKRDTLVKRIKRVFTPAEKVKNWYALKEWDGSDLPLSYMFHEREHPPKYLLNKGYTDEKLAELQAKDAEIHEAFTRQRENSAVGRTVRYLTERTVAGVETTTEAIGVFYVAISVLERGRTVPSPQILGRTIDTIRILASGDPRRAVESYVDRAIREYERY